MGKLKSFIIIALSVCCPILVCVNGSAAGVIQKAAVVSAGESASVNESLPKTESASETVKSTSISSSESSSSTEVSSTQPESTEDIRTNLSSVSGFESTSIPESAAVQAPIPDAKVGKIVTKNRPENEDDTDYSLFTEYDGNIYRYAFEKSDADDYITLESGAQVRNCTDEDNSTLLEAAKSSPEFKSIENIDTEPQVLIYHTHTTESYLPFGDKYDEEYPTRSRNPNRNMTAVGDAICSALSEHGIASLHDCTVHDYPQYTGAYYRSADSILEDMDQYPSLKIILDIHRDGILEENGGATAPAVEINGKSAAQFMIITGCENGEFDMPNYMENYKLACLLQNISETLYPNLARSVLFDYRNYNQSLSTNILLIEVGSQGNSLEEAIYTGKLLGDIIAKALTN